MSTEALTAVSLKIFIEQRLNELGAIYKNVNTCSSYQYLTSANSKEDPISTQGEFPMEIKSQISLLITNSLAILNYKNNKAIMLYKIS